MPESLVFNGEIANARGAMYLFENEKLTGSAILLKTDVPTAEKATEHLLQRYNVIGTSDNVYFFERGDLSLGITADASLGLVVLYLGELSSSSSGRILEFSTCLNDFQRKK